MGARAQVLPALSSVKVAPAVAFAVQVGAVIAAIGGLGFAAQQPWLFPSLAPTAVLQAQSPRPPTARPWNAVVGHCCGLLSGWVSVVTLHAQASPPVLQSMHLTFARLAAAVVALVMTTLLSELLRARHGASAATTLLLAEGSYRPNEHDILLVLAGVILTVALGEVVSQVRRHVSRLGGGGARPSTGDPVNAGSKSLSSAGPRC